MSGGEWGDSVSAGKEAWVEDVECDECGGDGMKGEDDVAGACPKCKGHGMLRVEHPAEPAEKPA